MRVARVVVVEEAVDQDLVGRARNADLQRAIAAEVVVVGLLDGHVGGQDAGAQLQRVGAGDAAVVVVVEAVLPVTAAEQEGVVAVPACHGVVAGATVEGVIAVAAVQAVVARVALQQVIAGLAIQGVVAAAAGDLVVATCAVEGVVAALTSYHVGAAGAPQVVVTRGAGKQDAEDGGGVPLGAVVEADLVDARDRVSRVVVVEESVDADLVGRASDTDLERAAAAEVVIVDLLEQHFARDDASLEQQDVGARDAAVVVVVKPVLAITPAKDEGVAAGAAGQGVVAGTAFERVVAVATIQAVIAFIAEKLICPGLAVEGVVADAATDGVVTGRAIERVIASSAIDRVVAAGATDVVVPRRAGQQKVDQLAGCPLCAVGKANFLDARIGVGGVVVVEEPVDAELVGRVGDAQFQRAVAAEVVVVGLPDDHVARCDAGLELQGVGARHATVVVVVKAVLPVTTAEQEGVAAGAGIERVVAGAAIQDVIAVATVQAVVAAAAVQRVVAPVAIERVIAGGAVQQVRPRAAVERLIARRAHAELEQQLRDVPNRAVVELDLLQPVELAGGRAAGQEAVEGDDVGRADDRQRQRGIAAGLGIGGTRHAHIGRRNSRLELQGVELAQVRV